MQLIGKRGIRPIKERTILVVALGLALIATSTLIVFFQLDALSAGADVSRSAESSGGADVSGSLASSAQVDDKIFALEASFLGHVLQSFSTASNTADKFTAFMLEATGVAEGFGEFSLVGMLVHDGSIVPPERTGGIGSTGVEGSGTMMFPEGMLRIRTSSSRICIDSADASNGTFVIDFQIVGGTNLFDEAEGQFTFEGMANRSVFTFTFFGALSGEIVLSKLPPHVGPPFTGNAGPASGAYTGYKGDASYP